mmetsp:Transcript_6794/g.26240  ORF Transcript_6794/g.26240 Transcript_6794/m.26240 type:complete len:390 (-) Transcript_6794:862-2031(-)
MVRIEDASKLDFKDVLIRPKRSTLRSRSEVDLVTSFTLRNSKVTWSGIPIMVANMDTTGTFQMAKTLAPMRLLTCLHKHYAVEEFRSFRNEVADQGVMDFVACSLGTSDADFQKTNVVLDACPEIKMLCIDVANGYSEHFVNHVRRVREVHPKIGIIAGNVVTGEMVEELLLTGADIIKVGIGPGSVCTTRFQTGVGYPQLSAIIECADAAHGLNGHIVGDGGCTCPGDFAKAFGGGADFVMAGGMFAGHDESGGELQYNAATDTWTKAFYGMSSAKAMKKHSGGVAEYRSSEGKAVQVPYRGSVRETVLDILGGIRSACTYVGAPKLKQMPKRTTFLRVSQQLNQVFGKSPLRGVPRPPQDVATSILAAQGITNGSAAEPDKKRAKTA